MGVIDEALEANKKYVSAFKLGHLTIPPARQLAVVACMDARLTVEELLGLRTGDAHIFRNAGGVVTEDALRSLVISHHLAGTQEVMIINHTDCGMLTFRDEELLEKLREESGHVVVSPACFHAFADLEANVQIQMKKVKSHPWLPDDLVVRGFVYDVRSGRLNEIPP